MDHKLRFFFYLAAVICFLLAAFGANLGGRMGRPGVASRLSLLPLGLALYLFPQLWDIGELAF